MLIDVCCTGNPSFPVRVGMSANYVGQLHLLNQKGRLLETAVNSQTLDASSGKMAYLDEPHRRSPRHFKYELRLPSPVVERKKQQTRVAVTTFGHPGVFGVGASDRVFMLSVPPPIKTPRRSKARRYGYT